MLQVSREEAEREQGTVNGNLLLCRRSTKTLMSSVSGLASVAVWRGWVSEREWGGANEHHRSLREGASSLYSETMGPVYGGLLRMRLNSEGGVSGRHCGLSVGVGVAVSVAGWLGRQTAEFRDVAAISVRGEVICDVPWAGRGWRHDGITVPCRRA
jgi:hypothetical protein